jgi:hypothetical protein
MKLTALFAALVLGASSVLAGDRPAVPIEQALKLAMEHLAERGLADQHYIGSLTLEDSTLSGGQRYWYARWVPSIKVDQKSESGLRINMDGSLARLTSGAPGGGRPDVPGRRSIGARNIR